MQNAKSKTIKPLNSLTKGKRAAFQELSERNDIVIIKAEKGGALVTMDVKGKDKF